MKKREMMDGRERERERERERGGWRERGSSHVIKIKTKFIQKKFSKLKNKNNQRFSIFNKKIFKIIQDY